ncbi:hypothetical protein JCM24511_04334 [Saitozyma sp. JCM 24511]|nr:hypothetical protein JCM24511_04334 [Saitozyma sp. JCM 24511]
MPSPNFTCIVPSEPLAPVGLTQLFNHPATLPCIARGSGMARLRDTVVYYRTEGAALASPSTRQMGSPQPNYEVEEVRTLLLSRFGQPGSAQEQRTAQPGDQPGEPGELLLWYHAWNIQQATTGRGVSWISKPWLEGLEAKGRWMEAVTEAERQLVQHRQDVGGQLELELDHQPGQPDRRTARAPLQFFDRSFPREHPGHGVFGSTDPTPTRGLARPRTHLVTRVARWMRNMSAAASTFVTRDPARATGGYLSSPTVSATLDLSSSLMQGDQLVVNPDCSWCFQFQSSPKGPSEEFQQCEISLTQRYPPGESPWYYGCYGQTSKQGGRAENIADVVLRRVLVRARREARCGIIELRGETWRYVERESGVYVIVERLDWSPEDVDVESMGSGEAETKEDEDSDVYTADEILGWGRRKRAETM